MNNYTVTFSKKGLYIIVKDNDKKIFLKGIYEYADYVKLFTFKSDITIEIKSTTEIDSSYE